MTQEVELRGIRIKDHATTKEIVWTLRFKVNSVTKEKQRLVKILEDSEEVCSSFKQEQICHLTQDLKTAHADIESLRLKWGRTIVAWDELIAKN